MKYLLDIPIFTILILLSSIAFIAGTVIPSYFALRAYRRKMDYYRRTTGLNPYFVPFLLRDLIPVAKKWGITDEHQRHVMFLNTSTQDKVELSKKIVGKEDLIIKWLALFQNRPLIPEAAAFAYMCKCVEEMELVIDASTKEEPSDSSKVNTLSTDSARVFL